LPDHWDRTVKSPSGDTVYWKTKPTHSTTWTPQGCCSGATVKSTLFYDRLTARHYSGVLALCLKLLL
jgi:hypothetical protein